MSRRKNHMRSIDEREDIRMAQHRKTAPLRKQIAELGWAITHESNTLKADALRKQMQPLQIKLARYARAYIDSDIASELVA